jgi:aromatic ring-cleaving dioxygenase
VSYSFNGKPEGPFPVAQFEVNLSTPAQFGAFVPWLAVWRGPLSVLVHPNTTEEGDGASVERRNHSQRAIWMGQRISLDMSLWERGARQ